MSDARMIRIIHRCAKMFVSLLEDEYGLGDKHRQHHQEERIVGSAILIRKKVLTTE